MPRLYSDLLDGTSRRYYFGLNSAPGGITNAEPARITLGGLVPTIQEQATVFRTPATAALTLFGYSAAAEPRLIPAAASLAIGGNVPGLLKIQVITNALPPDYTNLPDNAPTIIYVQTLQPARAVLTLNSLEHNITQGGNIGFISAGVATLTLAGYSANFPRFADVGLLTVNGHPASFLTTLHINPQAAELTFGGFAPRFTLPFVWIDEEPVPPVTWIDEPRV